MSQARGTCCQRALALHEACQPIFEQDQRQTPQGQLRNCLQMLFIQLAHERFRITISISTQLAFQTWQQKAPVSCSVLKMAHEYMAMLLASIVSPSLIAISIDEA